MSSDASYLAFLDKANSDAQSGAKTSSASGAGQFKAVDAGTQVPGDIQAACKDAFYVSDADEPFQGVSLRWEGQDGLPDEGQ